MLDDLPDPVKRRYGVDLFNATWDDIERATCTPADDDAMLATAYASAFRPFAYEALAAAESLGERIEQRGDRDHFFRELRTIVPPAATGLEAHP